MHDAPRRDIRGIAFLALGVIGTAGIAVALLRPRSAPVPASVPAPVQPKPAPSFAGDWEMREFGGASLALRLTQDGDTVSGQHCALPEGLEAFVCNGPVVGKAEGITARVIFSKTASGSSGIATLERTAEGVVWAVVSVPPEWEWAPMTALLTPAPAVP